MRTLSLLLTLVCLLVFSSSVYAKPPKTKPSDVEALKGLPGFDGSGPVASLTRRGTDFVEYTFVDKSGNFYNQGPSKDHKGPSAAELTEWLESDERAFYEQTPSRVGSPPYQENIQKKPAGNERIERFKLGEYRRLKEKGLARIVRIFSENRIQLQLVSPDNEIEVMTAHELSDNSVPTDDKAVRGKAPKISPEFSLLQIPQFMAGETAYFNGKAVEVVEVMDYNRFQVFELGKTPGFIMWTNADQLSKKPDNAQPNTAGPYDGKRKPAKLDIGCRIGFRNASDSGF